MKPWERNWGDAQTITSSSKPWERDWGNAETTETLITETPAPKEATVKDTLYSGYDSTIAAEMLSNNRAYSESIPNLRTKVAEASNPVSKWFYEFELSTHERKLKETENWLKEYQARQASVPKNPTLEKINNAGSFGEVWEAVKEHPIDAVVHGVASSAVPSAVVLGNALLGGRAGALSSGRMSGTMGAAVGGGISSFDIERKSGVMSGLAEAGVNISDPTQLSDALANKPLMDKIDMQAEQKAAVVGTVDGLSMGLAGKALGSTPVKNALAQALVQPIAGAVGEAGGSVYSGQAIKPGAVALEALAEIPSSVAETTIARWSDYRAKRGKDAEAAIDAGDFDSAERIIGEMEANKAEMERQMKAFESGELASNPSKPVKPIFEDYTPSEPVMPSIESESAADGTPSDLSTPTIQSLESTTPIPIDTNPLELTNDLPAIKEQLRTGNLSEDSRRALEARAIELSQIQPTTVSESTKGKTTAIPDVRLEDNEMGQILPTSQNPPESTISPEPMAEDSPIASASEQDLSANQENQASFSDYQAIFEALPQESEALAAFDHSVLSRAKPYFDAGLIKSPQDIQNFEEYGYPDLDQQPYGVMDWKSGELTPPDAPKPKLVEQMIREQQPFKPEALITPLPQSEGGNQSPSLPDFMPTHELPDGTPVVAVPDEANVWRTQEGEELIEPNATLLNPDLIKHYKTINKYQQDTQRVETAAQSAALSPLNDLPEPSPAQKEAGNYKKGMVHLHGLPIAIEQPKGSERKGVDKEGNTWSTTMAAHYGYVRGSKGFDGDPVDVFLGDDTANPHAPVFVVDQVKPDGQFDEHKVMLGYPTLEDAKQGYLANYKKGWQGLGSISPMSMSEFKDWLAKGDKSKPVSALTPAPVADIPAQSTSTPSVKEQALSTIAGEFEKGKKLVLVTGSQAKAATFKREGDILVGTDWAKQIKSKVRGKRFIFTTDKFLALAKSQDSLKQLVEAGNELVIITQKSPDDLIGLKVFQGLC